MPAVGSETKSKRHARSYLISTMVAFAAILIILMVLTGLGAAATHPVSSTSSVIAGGDSYVPGPNGPTPEIRTNITWNNQSFGDPLGYTYLSGSSLASGTLPYTISPLTKDPITMGVGDMGANGADSAFLGVPSLVANSSYGYTTTTCKDTSVSSACTEWPYPSNWAVTNETSNGTVTLSRTTSVSTGLSQLSWQTSTPLHAGFMSHFAFGISIPAVKLSVNPQYDWVTMQASIDENGECNAAGSISSPSAFCAAYPFITNNAAGISGGGSPFSTPCAYKTCAADTDFSMASGATSINVTANDAPAANPVTRLMSGDINRATWFPGTEIAPANSVSAGGYIYFSVPLSALSSVLSGSPNSWSNFTVGLAVVTSGGLIVHGNITGLAVSTLSAIPMLPGLSTDAGNTTTGKAWKAGVMNYTEVVIAPLTKVSSPIVYANPGVPSQFNLTALAPTWGMNGWLSVTSGFSSAAPVTGEYPSQEGYSAQVVIPSTLPTTTVTVTLPSSTNVQSPYEVKYNVSWGTILPVSYNLYEGRNAAVIDELNVAPDQYINETEATLLYNGQWEHSYNTATYQGFSVPSWHVNVLSCLRAVPKLVNDSLLANDSAKGGDATTASCAPYYMPSGATAGNPGTTAGSPLGAGLPPSTHANSTALDYTVQYTEAQYNVTVCPTYPTAQGCPTTITPPPPGGGGTPTVISFSGEMILVGLLVLAGILALVFWAGKDEEKRTIRTKGRR